MPDDPHLKYHPYEQTEAMGGQEEEGGEE